MNALEFTLLVALGSFLGGLLGALTGPGGGVIVVPLLTLVFGVDIRYAIGASLVSVIATSSSCWRCCCAAWWATFSRICISEPAPAASRVFTEGTQ